MHAGEIGEVKTKLRLGEICFLQPSSITGCFLQLGSTVGFDRSPVLINRFEKQEVERGKRKNEKEKKKKPMGKEAKKKKKTKN